MPAGVRLGVAYGTTPRVRAGRIETGKDVKQHRGVFDCPRQRPDMIETKAQGNNTARADDPARWLQADERIECRGDTSRSRRICAQREARQPGSYRDRGSGTGTTR